MILVFTKPTTRADNKWMANQVIFNVHSFTLFINGEKSTLHRYIICHIAQIKSIVNCTDLIAQIITIVNCTDDINS